MTSGGMILQRLVKRELDMGDYGGISSRLSISGAAVMTVTFVVFFIGLLAVAYMFHVIATLAFIEKQQSETGVMLHPSALDEEGDGGFARQDAITSSIRGTINHLSVVGGFWARWRGLACQLCTQLVFAIIAGLATALIQVITFGKLPYLDQVIGSLATSVALCHWRTAWTHIVISSPSPKKWIDRVPPFRMTVKNVWLATLVQELASRVAIVAPMSVFFALGLDNHAEHSAGAIVAKAIPVALLALALYVLLAIPANVALTRVQASMLPDEDETIVPFDRSFGGKVDPAIVGGSGALGFVDAWKSLTRQARNRIVRLCLKVVLITSALYIVGGLVLSIELMAFLKATPANEPQLTQ